MTFWKLRGFITGLVFLRRISRALEAQNKLLERNNELLDAQLNIEHPAAYRAYKSNKGQPTRVASISVASVDDWNRQWYESHPLDESDTS